jgi:hypothetical protein
MPTLSLQLTFCHAFLQSGDPRQKGRLNGVPFASPIDPPFLRVGGAKRYPGVLFGSLCKSSAQGS